MSREPTSVYSPLRFRLRLRGSHCAHSLGHVAETWPLPHDLGVCFRQGAKTAAGRILPDVVWREGPMADVMDCSCSIGLAVDSPALEALYRWRHLRMVKSSDDYAAGVQLSRQNRRPWSFDLRRSQTSEPSAGP